MTFEALNGRKIYIYFSSDTIKDHRIHFEEYFVRDKRINTTYTVYRHYGIHNERHNIQLKLFNEDIVSDQLKQKSYPFMETFAALF